MNKNVLYLAIFGILCALAGAVVGAVIVNKASLPCFGPERTNFSERAERFLWHGTERMRQKQGKGRDGLFKMLITKLALDQGQQAKVREILEQTRRQIDEIGEGVRNTVAGIKEKSDRQIMDILTPEQQEKFSALLKEFQIRRGHMQERGNHGPMMGHGTYPDEKIPAQK